MPELRSIALALPRAAYERASKLAEEKGGEAFDWWRKGLVSDNARGWAVLFWGFAEWDPKEPGPAFVEETVAAQQGDYAYLSCGQDTDSVVWHPAKEVEFFRPMTTVSWTQHF